MGRKCVADATNKQPLRDSRPLYLLLARWGMGTATFFPRS